MKKYLLTFLFLSVTFLYGQDYNIESDGNGGFYYKTELGFGLGSEDNLPFWMRANKFGIVPAENYGLWSIELKKEFESSKKLDWSLGVLGSASVSDNTEFRFRDYYLGVRYGKLRMYLGAKANKIQYDGLSSTNGNFIESSNARPYPKLLIELPYTDVPFTKGILQFKGAFSEGIMIEDRYVDKPHIHHKNLYLKATKAQFSLEFGLNHYAQWGGDSPKFGKLPSNFDAYMDVFFAKDNSDYDQIAASFDKNRVGNHLGMLDGRFHYKGEHFAINLYRQVIFEDDSGRNFFNRDALHGIYLKRAKDKAWFQSFLFEWFYTKKQSGDKVGKKPGEDKLWTGRDNYFNHSVYKSGWTSYGQTIGTPFFTPIENDNYTLGVSNNRVKALHGGVFGYIANKFPYKALLSYSSNIGTYAKPIAEKKQVSGYLEMTIPVAIREFPVNISWGVAADKGEYLEDSMGAFVKISTNGWWRK
ncbi:capsule assembly protein Wzi [Balneicella halophila]|uniref:Capsule assembly protein Wzi n=2 Tax=Balneicella halophila TaxID=1537566 RepID=A0A7L4UP64_BALHA|nr:capsule assembly protein Wzi [Balneicella halophila]